VVISMADITAIILTKNEILNIEGAINSIKGFAKRIIVVDSGSTDGTCERARELGAETVFHEFEYYARQFNWAIDNMNITTRWIMRIDADERMTDDVIRESERVINSAGAQNGEITGVAMEAVYVFMNRQILHGIPKKRKIIIFRNGIGRIEDRRRDAHSIISEGVSEKIKPRFIHHDYKDLDSYCKRYAWYATREMMDYIDYKRGASQSVKTDKDLMKTRAKKFGLYYKFPKFLRARMWFLYNYIFRLGFLDGREGYMYHYLECYWYRNMVDAKILEYEKTGKLPAKLGAIE